MLVPGGLQFAGNQPSLLQGHQFQGQGIHFILPATGAEEEFTQRVPNWEQTVGIWLPPEFRTRVDTDRWFPGEMDRNFLVLNHA